MTTTAHTLHQHVATAAAESARVAAAVRPEQLDGPTPCPEFDVRALANHLVLWTGHSFEARARGASVSEDLQQHDFTAEEGWPAAYRAQLDRALAAWEDPAAWEQELDLGGTTMPAEAAVGMILMELALHGWDLAQAIGERYWLPEATAQAVLGQVEEYAGMYRQYEGFAGAVELPAGAPAFERAVALSGRKPLDS